jgi:D-glycero-D-manno-heptose 1,7-bisphosphate phosphatase
MAALRRAAFLDRDGTLNRPPAPGRYVTAPDELELLDGVADAVEQLRRSGYATVVVSNQRGVALGELSEDDLASIDARLRDLVELDGAYYCTHHLDAGCGCRKPEPGMLTRAAAELELDLSRSLMIGDSDSDVEAGRRAGCLSVQVAPTDGALLAAVDRLTSSGNPDVAGAARAHPT